MPPVAGPVRLFLRASVDPEADLRRGFSGVYNSWVDHPSEIEEAVLEAYPDGAAHLPPPRRDPVTGWWCWEPEDGISAFGFEDAEGYAGAMARVLPYGAHLGCLALFAADDFSPGAGADGEDLFRDGTFLGWLRPDDPYERAAALLDSHKPAEAVGDEPDAGAPRL